MTAKDIPATVRAEVRARSGGRCEARIPRVCHGTAVTMHHRQRRREGDHSAGNLAHLCDWCHRWCHANPAKARELDLIRSAFTPAEETA